MSTRTIKQALEHAEQQRQYPLRESADLITDFILLADELNRLCSYTCKHPFTDPQTAFVSEGIAKAVFSEKMIFDQTPVAVDPNMTDMDGIHFPQPDGTCVRYNI